MNIQDDEHSPFEIAFASSENSVGSESLIKGDAGNESKKSEKVTTKSVRTVLFEVY